MFDYINNHQDDDSNKTTTIILMNILIWILIINYNDTSYGGSVSGAIIMML